MRNKYNPKYTYQVLVPQHLDITISDCKQMSDSYYKEYLEKIRNHFLELININKHPILGSNLTITEITSKLKSLCNSNGCRLVEYNGSEKPFYQSNLRDGALIYNSDGTKAINHWVPELFHTKRANGVKVSDQFFNKEKFQKNVNAIVLKDRFKFLKKNPNMKISQAIKLGLRIVNGNQPVYNFPTGLSKWIVLNVANRFNPKDDFNILDTSTGWYGRLAGVLAACSDSALKNVKVNYLGTDVNSSIHDRFDSIIGFWKERINSHIKFNGYKSLVPSEKIFDDSYFYSQKGLIDLAFTSPPYFDTEKYSDDSNQSYLNYPVYNNGMDNSWIQGFLKKTIENTFEMLKPGAEYWLNIADVKCSDKDYGLEYYPLEDDTVELALKAGFRHIKTYLMLSPLLANFKNSVYSYPKNHVFNEGKQYKYEPIFVFKKPY